jgi:hypothetical protein
MEIWVEDYGTCRFDERAGVLANGEFCHVPAFEGRIRGSSAGGTGAERMKVLIFLLGQELLERFLLNNDTSH